MLKSRFGILSTHPKIFFARCARGRRKLGFAKDFSALRAEIIRDKTFGGSKSLVDFSTDRAITCRSSFSRLRYNERMHGKEAARRVQKC